MAFFSVMGRKRGGGARVAAAVSLALALVVPFASHEGRAAALTSPSGAAPVPTTTLPSIPKIDPQYTDGQSPATLLAHAISLASLGVDHTAVAAAVTATQNRLDSDALTARQAQSASDAAGRLAGAARAQEQASTAAAEGMSAALRQAVVELYMAGPDPLTVNPGAGRLALYAQDYADSALGPYGVLAQHRAIEQQQSQASRVAEREARLAAALASKARKALADQQAQLHRLDAELTAVSASSALAVAADHNTLASEAAKELLSASSLQFTPKAPLPPPVSTTSVALTWAFAELGKEYVWGATGPDTFDCSGLTQFVWRAAGVDIPRVAADQDAWAIPVPLSQLLPGDLVFFGTTDIHHVGIYIGDGLMINAPHTGTVVQVSSIWWSDLAGFGRVHAPGTPVPPHNTPTPSAPAVPAVLPTAGPVPSQTKPPTGWKPKPGETTPIRLGTPEPGSSGRATTTPDIGTTTTSTSTVVTSTTSTSTTDPSSSSTTSTTVGDATP